MKSFSLSRFAFGLVLAAGCIGLGAAIPTVNQAHGEVRGSAEPQTFQNGSVPVLREISATLRQMDGRLARLELVAQKLQTRSAAQRSETGN